MQNGQEYNPYKIFVELVLDNLLIKNPETRLRGVGLKFYFSWIRNIKITVCKMIEDGESDKAFEYLEGNGMSLGREKIIERAIEMLRWTKYENCIGGK